MTEVTVRLTDEVRAALEKIAATKGISLDQLVADAVGLELTAAEILDKGGRVLGEYDGTFEEILV